MPTRTATPTTVSLSDLLAGPIPHSTLLSAFGPDSLGILVVSGLPSNFATLRRTVLANSSRLAALPGDVLKGLTRPSAKYLVGWSHGVETLREGVVDDKKGSFYVGCGFYQERKGGGGGGDFGGQEGEAEKWVGFEEYTAGNVWPPEEKEGQDEGSAIPGFRESAEELIALIIDTAVLVARACDRFAEQEIDGYQRGYLEEVVKTSTTTKARLLHYFPAAGEEGVDGSSSASDEGGSEQSDGDSDDWCATHLDHGCLTGLTSAMFLDEADGNFPDQLEELAASPSPKSGLYIKSRNGEVYKVAIPRDCLAFQTGETLELITQGKFKAVPHFVRGVDGKDLKEQGRGHMRVARNTLAVFTQPNLGAVVDTRNGLTFGEFARGVVKKNTV
jgi:hypothetical protein